MKIIKLQAENVKKLVAIEISPDGNLVQVTGKNGQGKTSVLDSIWWALAGADNIQAAPIRKGADKAKIRLDLGEIIVTRSFSRKGDGDYTSSITVENADGARFPSPQGMIDSLLGELTFDPLAFARAKDKEQFDTLRKFVTGFDFDQNAKDRKKAFDDRTDVNRDAKKSQAAADAISVSPTAPAEAIDVVALTKQLKDAGDHNTLLETRKTNRQNAKNRIEHVKAEAQRLINEATADIEAESARSKASVTEWQDQIAALNAKISGEAARLKTACETISANATTQGNALIKEGEELLDRLAKAEPLPDAIDASAIEATLAKAHIVNKLVDDWTAQTTRRKEHQADADKLGKQSEGLTANIAELDEAKDSAIRKSHLPVDGLGFGDGFITLAGLPFNQASDAEQLRASVAIAAAMNPKLRVIRVRDGSLLDDDGMKLLADIADKNDMQIWVERVDSTGKIGFVLEDGHLKAAE